MYKKICVVQCEYLQVMADDSLKLDTTLFSLEIFETIFDKFLEIEFSLYFI